MKPGDYIIYPTADHVTYVWKVTGVYIGALGHEDVVGLESVGKNRPSAHGEDIEEMFAPLALVQDHAFQRIAGSGILRGVSSRRSP